jgi:hypothetical protein
MRGKLLMTTPSTVGAHVTVIDDDPALVLSGACGTTGWDSVRNMALALLSAAAVPCVFSTVTFRCHSSSPSPPAGRALGVLPADMSADDFHPSSSVHLGVGGGGSGSSSGSSAPAVAAVPTSATPQPAPTVAAAATNGADIAAAATASSVRYVSTRATPGDGGAPPPTVGFSDAVFAGLAPDGGLYVPTAVPKITKEEASEAARLVRALVVPVHGV